MNILRLPPYTEPLAEYTVPGEDTYTLKIKEFSRDVVVMQEEQVVSYGVDSVTIPWVVTDINDNIVVDFRKYDDTYVVEIFDSFGDVVVEDTLTIERPYVDPNTLVTQDYTLAQATNHESIARAMIDSITDGFYFKIDWMEATGEGTDYMPVWSRVYKVLKAYQNSKLVYDSSLATPALEEWNYLITKDKSAIIKDPAYPVDEYNRSESNPNPTFIAVSDSIGIFETDDSANTFTMRPGVNFPVGADYLFLLESGYKVVPSDIKDATLMLIDDLKCGKLDYYKRYITSYSTDQFRIQMDKSVINGTGNILVDKILDKYVTNIKKMRML